MVKIVNPQGRHESFERSFRRLAAILASIDHPGLARVQEAGLDGDTPYMIMDLVGGRSLAKVLGGGRLAVADTIHLGIDVAEALSAAHHARLLHGDLGPRSIMINACGAARVVGFAVDAAATAGDGADAACARGRVAAPRREIDGRGDLYSLGAVLYECVIGRPPYPGGHVGGAVPARAGGAPPDPRTFRPELPLALSRIIHTLLAEDPDRRYQSADGLVADLRRLASGAEPDFHPCHADARLTRPGPPMLGRDGELAAVLHAWDQARRGVGGVVLVSGPAGSGKTRLAGEVRSAIGRQGALVLAGKCEPDEGVPLGPLRRAIDDHLRELARRPALDHASGLDLIRAAAGPAAPLLSGLTVLLDDALGADTRAEADRHHQVLVAVADFLSTLAASYGGALLHLDDTQWTDVATRRVLQHLGDRLAEAPLLMLLTGRDDPHHATTIASIRSAVRHLDYADLRLRPLPVDVVAQLVSCATGGLEVDTATAASLAARSGGNAFALLQYLDALVDAGLLQPDRGRWLVDLRASRKLIAADDGVELILRRLDGLDADSRAVLGIAAVHGAVFDYHFIATACSLPRHRVLDVADTAAWRNLVERRADGRYRFLHDRIREALVAQYEPDALRAVHQRLADALAAADAREAEDAFALARHCVLGEPGRDPDQAVRACAAAGELALADHAPAEAVRHLDAGQQIARSHGRAVDARFMIVLATAQQRAGQFVSAAATASAALDLTADPLERSRLLGLIAQAKGTAWEGRTESENILAALRSLGRAPSRWLPAQSMTTTSMFLLGQLIRLSGIGLGTARGRRRAAYELEASLYAAAARAYGVQLQPIRSFLCLLRQVYPVARVGPGPEQAHLSCGFALAELAVGLRRAARRHVDQAVRIARDIGDPTLISLVSWMDALGRHSFGLDQGDALRGVLAEQGRWLDLGTHSDLIIVLLWEALYRGDIGEAQRLADERETLIRNTGDPHCDATARLQSATVARGALAALAAWRDRPAEASMHLDNRPEDARLAGWERFPLYGAAIVAAYQRHDLGDAFDETVAEFDALDTPVRILLPVGLGFYLCRAQGRVEQLRQARGPQRRRRHRQARAALRVVDHVARTPLLRAQVDVTRAALLQVAGEPEAALRHLARREAYIAAVKAPSVAFESARVRAFAWRDLGDACASHQQAHLALALARQQGWPHHARRITSDFGLDEPVDNR